MLCGIESRPYSLNSALSAAACRIHARTSLYLYVTTLQEYIAADMSLAGVGFMARVAVHVGVGASSLGMVLLGLYRTEGDLLSGIRQMRKPTVS